MRLPPLLILVLGVLAPFGQSQAKAWFRFSNSTSKTLYVAFVRNETGCTPVPWEKRGWWRLEPGQTKTVQGGRITNRYSYFYAESADRAWRWTSAGPSACLPNPAFTWCWTTCNNNPTTRQLNVRKVDTDNYDNYTVNLVPPPTTMRTVQVMVHRHSSVNVTDADADRILADMGTVLQTADQSNDVATRVRFVRNGPVRVLSSSVAAVIQTQAQWNTLMSSGTGVKIVREIRWCGGPGGSIIGCAPVGSGVVNLAAVRFTAPQEGILWVHEYGHNAGLGHRTDDVNAVMFPSIATNRRVVNATESSRYLGGPVAATGEVMAMGSADTEASFEPPQDVREFVRRHYFEGVPYDAAASYTSSDADVLLEMLANPGNDEEFLPEIVTTLCLIGSEKAVEPLIRFVKGASSSKAAFNGKNAALIHLGDLINKTANKVALEFLASVASDRAVAKSLAAPRAPVAAAEAKRVDIMAPTAAELAEELAVSATQGLGLAGSDEAAAVLDKLRASPTTSAVVSQAAAEAANTCKAVRSMGLERYYKRARLAPEMRGQLELPRTPDVEDASQGRSEAELPAGAASATSGSTDETPTDGDAAQPEEPESAPQEDRE